MHIYFSGIGGVGIGPLAEIAHDAGYTVSGSDQSASLTTAELETRGIPISDNQSGDFLRALHDETPIDWFVYTAGLPADHPELLLARELGIRTSKRDELLSEIITEKNLKLIAVAGTHGKTTTTSMLVWAFKQLGTPASYSVGSTLSFGPAGRYDPTSEYFVYECDEFDRNFLHFRPHEALLLSIDYDHPDIFATVRDYREAFEQFALQSHHVTSWQSVVGNDIATPSGSWLLRDDEVLPLQLPGAHNRQNATLAAKALEHLGLADTRAAIAALESFPGSGRRFEQLAEHLYTDYGHHPVEIAATLQMARELSEHVVLVYQPHQNVRQHEVKDQYTDCMQLAEHIYWLPTYLSREDPALPILTPAELTEHLVNRNDVTVCDMDDELWRAITSARESGKLVICMGAGSIDGWVRRQLTA